MTMPSIDPSNRSRPLCYDPERGKFILYDEIVSGEEPIIPPSSLGPEDRKRLVIERQRQGPDYAVQPISGPRAGRDDVIESIERGDDLGLATVEAECSYLDEFLAQIQRALPR